MENIIYFKSLGMVTNDLTLKISDKAIKEGLKNFKPI
jgi:hypothetical protein